jgi:spore coat protein CotH
MNRYLHDQEFLGLKAFVLDNALTDRTLIHESVAMRLYARMGLVVPREAPARLFVNGEYAGAYVIVEAIDRTFVSRVFGTEEGDVEDGGYLFEYRWVRVYGFEYLGPGLEPYATIFEPHTRETDSLFSLYRPFEQLARAIDESPPERILPDVGRLIGIPELITLVAIQNFLGELDGFVGKWGMANFYLYRFREDRPALVIPWDADHAFSLPTDLSIDYMLDTNVLVGRIMADEGLRRFYLDALLRAAEISAAADAGDSRGWLEREIDRQAALVAPSVAADPVANPEEFEAALTALRTFSRVRPAYVSCAVGLAIDPDQSGRSCIVP